MILLVLFLKTKTQFIIQTIFKITPLRKRIFMAKLWSTRCRSGSPFSKMMFVSGYQLTLAKL